MVHIAPCPGEKIIDTQDLITALEQSIAQMRAMNPAPPVMVVVASESGMLRAPGQSILAVSLTHFCFIYALNK